MVRFSNKVMAEKPLDTSQDQAPFKGNTLDLNTLSELDFGPSWADKSPKQPVIKTGAPSKGTSTKEQYSRDSSKRDRRSSFGNNQPKGGERKKEGKTYYQIQDYNQCPKKEMNLVGRGILFISIIVQRSSI